MSHTWLVVEPDVSPLSADSVTEGTVREETQIVCERCGDWKTAAQGVAWLLPYVSVTVASALCGSGSTLPCGSVMLTARS